MSPQYSIISLKNKKFLEIDNVGEFVVFDIYRIYIVGLLSTTRNRPLGLKAINKIIIKKYLI